MVGNIIHVGDYSFKTKLNIILIIGKYGFSKG